MEQQDLTGLLRHVRSRSDSEPDLCARQGGGVVDAISDERYMAPGRRVAPDQVDLPLGTDPRLDVVDPDRLRHAPGRGEPVPRHHDNLEAELVERTDRLDRPRHERGSEHEEADGPSVLDHDRPAIARDIGGGRVGSQFGEVDALLSGRLTVQVPRPGGPRGSPGSPAPGQRGGPRAAPGSPP